MIGDKFPSIDVHVHYVPAFYQKAVEDAGEAQTDGVPLPRWTPEMHLESMAHLNIATAMLAISSPGIHFGNDTAARKLARDVNEFGGTLVRDHPTRFGLLAALPVPDCDGSLAEIEYAAEVLHADGFKLPTHSRGVYLGDVRLDPVFEELSRRQSVVVIHPQKPSAVPANVLVGYPIPMMEFLFDTTRAITNMIMNRTLQRYPGVRLILPHAGAFLSVLADRLTGRRRIYAAPGHEGEAPDIHEALRRMYYDLAGYPVPGQLFALRQMVGADRLLYGSDWPFTPEMKVAQLQQKLLATDLLTQEQRRAAFHDNAVAIFPRLAKHAAHGSGN